MVLRNAKLVAFDGTHASGKTTLIYAVAALLRRQGVHVTTLEEPARTSPFVDDVVIHKAGDFDMPLELDIFAAHITNTLRAARSHDVVFADKTPTNVLGRMCWDECAGLLQDVITHRTRYLGRGNGWRDGRLLSRLEAGMKQKIHRT